MSFVRVYLARLVAALLLAPLMTPVTFLVHRQLQWGGDLILSDLTIFFVAYAFFAYQAMLIFGLAAYILFLLLRLKSVAFYAIGGAVIGYVVSVTILTGYPPISFTNPWNEGAERIWYLLAAALSAIAFRLILGNSLRLQLELKKVIDEVWGVLYHPH